MNDQTGGPADSPKSQPKRQSMTAWHAFVTDELGMVGVITTQTRKQLSQTLGNLGMAQVHSIVKGRQFSVKVKKMFEFANSLEPKSDLGLSKRFQSEEYGVEASGRELNHHENTTANTHQAVS